MEINKFNQTMKYLTRPAERPAKRLNELGPLAPPDKELYEVGPLAPPDKKLYEVGPLAPPDNLPVTTNLPEEGMEFQSVIEGFGEDLDRNERQEFSIGGVVRPIIIDLIPKVGKITDDISAALKSYRLTGRTKKYFQPHQVTINGQKYIIRADDFRASQAKQLQQGFKDLNKWKKDPTVRNWNNIFRTPAGQQTAFSKNIRSYITGKKSTGGLPLSSNTKKLFDKLKVKNLIGPETEIMKDYTSDYFKKLRPTFGATQAAAEKLLKISAEEVKQLAPIFKTKTKRSLEEITKKLNPNFNKYNEIDKAAALQQTSNKVAKYLQFLKGQRKAGKLQQPKKTDEIINFIERETSDFRFQEGTIRDMKFLARDKELGLKPGTTRNQRGRFAKTTQKGFVVDESVGLSATYKNAPGYTEATQVLKKDINNLKGIQIDRTFTKVLQEVVDGNTSNVNSYNKKARKFMKENLGVDAPIIRTGKNLDPKKYVKFYDKFSPEAQRKILEQSKKQNFVIETKSKPIRLLLDEAKGDSNLTATIISAAPFAGITIPEVGETAETMDENKVMEQGVIAPATLGAAGVASLAAKPVRQTVGKFGRFAGQVAKGALKLAGKGARMLVGPVELPVSIAAGGLYANYQNQLDFAKALDRTNLSENKKNDLKNKFRRAELGLDVGVGEEILVDTMGTKSDIIGGIKDLDKIGQFQKKAFDAINAERAVQAEKLEQQRKEAQTIKFDEDFDVL